ncbi:hypothetical protein ABB37_01326 [Leptomonas pyrrhocoris]|uniref:Uncharacterized protein n=1 Tax=Leptomonas pyrrhocoris TaxID=157538 RepID=A0A0M9G8D4_LEPPY|nr:hypothetical protein ABB37_01326 [Leptomonas pyrrhocoris]XP_015663299.1 hypothetical protein ABB37_01326 [Leptomonas pyrrhocoris]KPA84859.1 hypothetical protein ABB37_01326 [Leptomonas pyrrhocoris]KPA84860.1 hypothetical protein ABB37_01326 [Leptomonas pyrrhocoris]|eukprot:XP_015663298.1 hypothetical protein ABB37_01326 [Leptomonas pyrrhocoris]
MANAEGDLIASYCVGLVSAFRRLSQDLCIPQIDQELYTDLFISPLEAQLCGNEGGGADAAASSAPKWNTSASDVQAEALVSLGGAELIVTALRAHEQQTLQVLGAIALRESVVTRMWSCCDAFDKTNISASEEVRFTFLRLLQEHQLVTLLTTESIFEWREMLSRPYPFLLRNGENYLQVVVDDCTAFDAHALVRSLASIRLRHDPLCAKVNLKRMLHRLETMRRSRLITTGALWNVGLRPLQPSPPARSRSRSAGVRRPPSAANNKDDKAARGPVSRTSLPIPRTPPRSAPQRTSGALLYYGGKPDDSVGEVTLLHNAFARQHSGREGMASQVSGVTSASSPGNGSTAKCYPTPRPPPRNDSAETRQRQQHRLLTVAHIIENETALQRKIVEELYELAHSKERFVPLLDIPQLFSNAGAPPAQGAALKLLKTNYPGDSWPLDRAQWPAVVAAERRIDRLGCMSTAREALQTCNLLPAWQQRMGRRMSDISTHLRSHSKTSATSASASADGPPTPLKAATNARVQSAHSLTYSDSMERPSAGSASGLAVDTRRPVMTAAEQASAYSYMSSSLSASTPSSSVSRADSAKGKKAQENKRTAPPAHSESFPSSSESKSDHNGNRTSYSATLPNANGDRSPNHHHAENGEGESGRRQAAPSASPASSVTPSSSHPSSSVEPDSKRPSLDELREQLLAEHRLNSRSQSYNL